MMFQIIPINIARERGLLKYFTGKKCKRGHTDQRYVKSFSCVSCARKKSVERYHEKNGREKQKQYRKTEAGNLAQKKYNSTPKAQKYRDAYRKSEKRKSVLRKYRASEKGMAYQREWMRKKRKTESGQIETITRNLIMVCLKASGQKKYTSTEKSLGYSSSELKAHIEAQFLHGMNWNNRSEWHIDHITPISKFISDGITDPKIINALPNLRPIWAKENLSKKDKIEFLI